VFLFQSVRHSVSGFGNEDKKMNLLIAYFLFQVLGLYALTLSIEYLVVPGSKYLLSRPPKFLSPQVSVQKEKNQFKKAS
jgi:hypothetical protein